jgi:ABC-type lipopolysaccharide export system ATPase subunit
VGNKLSEIECDICELGKIFFDDTMNITLTPGKESSTGTIRPSFDLKIEYDGVEYSDVKALSTGERKRLSLVLMIVLTAYVDGKIMLLDEALNSVGVEMRGIIMNELTKLHIPILITSHDDLVGYTSELKIDNI